MTTEVWKDRVNKRLDDHDTVIQEVKDQQLIDGHDIKNLKEGIQEIKDDIKWTRRAITNSFIVALVGGSVAIFYAALKLS
ncbi:hemolysin XhlA family protein [Jeotgalibacillus marinus]|uniref:Hemolysin XhlA family protein n=1 Tax=Jeotgalibacillus marinus TaxID=86667 RepID=A0ABV3Q8F7_9BACL